MYAAIQRVARVDVDVEGTVVEEITGPGLMMLLGVARDDGCERVATLARKIAELCILEGERFVMEIDAPILVVN